MKTLDTIAGKTYVVTSPNGCTVTDETELTLGTVEAGQQKVFVATGAKMHADDDSARITATFSAAPALGNGSGGGVSIQFDTKPTSGSTNAVTSGGLYNVIFARNLALGLATATGSNSIALGFAAEATGMASNAIGANSKAQNVGATALGNACQASKPQSIAIGSFAKVKDNSAICIGTQNSNNSSQLNNSFTYFYIIAAGSPLSETYESGEACLGYVVKESNGNILACGTRKLSELLTNNTAFAPAALDLDAPAPTPFLPTGIMEPIEIDTPEDLSK